MSFHSYDRESLWGLYQYDENILDTLELPASFSSEEKRTIKDNILIESAELELYYTDPAFLKVAIGVWSKKQVPVWERLKTALEMEYNPIENYDRLESWTDSFEGSTESNGRTTLSNTNSNHVNDTTNITGSDTGTIAHAGTKEVDTENTERNTIDETIGNDISETTSGTSANTETRNLSKSATGHVATESSSENDTTDSKSTDSETLNKVNGANLSEGWADHDKSIIDALEQGSSHSEGTGTSATDSTDTETDTGTIGNSGTTSGSKTVDNDTERNVVEAKTATTDYDESNSDTETRNLASTERNVKEVTASGSVAENGTSSDTTESTNESTHEGRTHGNIGVTTSQQMLESEMVLRTKYYIMDIIINDFISKFCLRVY